MVIDLAEVETDLAAGVDLPLEEEMTSEGEVVGVVEIGMRLGEREGVCGSSSVRVGRSWE